MKVFLITVRPPTSVGGRYFDSIWVVKEHAEQRLNQLRDELRRSGFRAWFSGQVVENEWYLSMVEAYANDAQIEPQGKIA